MLTKNQAKSLIQQDCFPSKNEIQKLPIITADLSLLPENGIVPCTLFQEAHYLLTEGDTTWEIVGTMEDYSVFLGGFPYLRYYGQEAVFATELLGLPEEEQADICAKRFSSMLRHVLCFMQDAILAYQETGEGIYGVSNILVFQDVLKFKNGNFTNLTKSSLNAPKGSSWEVRSHTRRLPNGKTITVSGYRKGDHS